MMEGAALPAGNRGRLEDVRSRLMEDQDNVERFPAANTGAHKEALRVGSEVQFAEKTVIAKHRALLTARHVMARSDPLEIGDVAAFEGRCEQPTRLAVERN